MKNNVIYRPMLCPQLNASRCFYTQSIRTARLKRFISPIAQFSQPLVQFPNSAFSSDSQSEIYYLIKSVQKLTTDKSISATEQISTFMAQFNKLVPVEEGIEAHQDNRFERIRPADVEANFEWFQTVVEQAMEEIHGTQVSFQSLVCVFQFCVEIGYDNPQFWKIWSQKVKEAIEQYTLDDQEPRKMLESAIQFQTLINDMETSQFKDVVDEMNIDFTELIKYPLKGLLLSQLITADALLKPSNLSILTNGGIVQVLELVVEFKMPAGDATALIENIDVELTSRLSAEGNTVDLASMAKLLYVVAYHNLSCEAGQELAMEYFMVESMQYVFPKFASLDRAEFLNAGSAYASVGVFQEASLANIQSSEEYFEDKNPLQMFEKHLLTRVPQLTLEDCGVLLRVFAQAESGTADGFYRVMERRIAPTLTPSRGTDIRTIYSILKAFTIADQNMGIGFDASRIFLRVIRVIQESLPEMPADEMFAILRLYADLELNTAAALWEQVADEVKDRKMATGGMGLSEQGFVDAIISMKLAPTDKVRPVSADLERQLLQRTDQFQLESLAQIFRTYSSTALSEGKPLQTSDRLTPYEHLFEGFVNKLNERNEALVRGDDVEVLRPETAMQVFLCFKEYSANPYMAKWSASELAEKLRLILPDIVAAKDHLPSQVLRIALEEISAYSAQVSDQGKSISYDHTRVELRGAYERRIGAGEVDRDEESSMM